MVLLQDTLNPQKVFNINKYYEFAYKAKLKGLEDMDLKNIEKAMHEQELRTQQAIFEEEFLVKRSPTLTILGIVLSELNSR